MPDTPSRREFAVSAVGFLGGVALLASCRGGDESCCYDSSGGDTGPGGDTGTAADVDWATGGTASMSGDYADPFTADAEGACSMLCAMTLGPCYAETLERKDISEGFGGLPVRLALRVLDTNCNPVEGVYVDVWHATSEGLYSGPDAADMCTGADADMLANRYFRGVQRTDANGRVDFDTCFPGWYSGRAVHIHIQVRTGTTEGTGESVTSQLFFDAALIEEIYASHPEYEHRGQPDTTNDEDDIIADDPEPYTLVTAKQADGALLAWKTLVIRASTAEELCEVGSGRGQGPPP